MKTSIISIKLAKGAQELSPAQKQFNRLVKNIEKERDNLVKWHTIIPIYHQRYAAELLPRIQKKESLQADLIRLIDQAYKEPGLTKKEREKARNINCFLIDPLMDHDDTHGLKELYNYYTQSDFDREIEDEKKDIFIEIKNKFGIDLGDPNDAASKEDVMKAFLKGLKEQQESMAKKSELPRKKSKKTIDKENRILAKEKELSQSMKELYRKLVASVHPDKEPDEKERERKTALMQKLNEAYEKNNLLELLEIELSLEKLDKDKIYSVSMERLVHYNEILRGQLESIKQEILHVQMKFRMNYDFPPGAILLRDKLLGSLTERVADTDNKIRSIEKDLVDLREKKMLKAWIKNFTIPVVFNVAELMEFMGV